MNKMIQKNYYLKICTIHLCIIFLCLQSIYICLFLWRNLTVCFYTYVSIFVKKNILSIFSVKKGLYSPALSASADTSIIQIVSFYHLDILAYVSAFDVSSNTWEMNIGSDNLSMYIVSLQYELLYVPVFRKFRNLYVNKKEWMNLIWYLQ